MVLTASFVRKHLVTVLTAKLMFMYFLFMPQKCTDYRETMVTLQAAKKLVARPVVFMILKV